MDEGITSDVAPENISWLLSSKRAESNEETLFRRDRLPKELDRRSRRDCLVLIEGRCFAELGAILGDG